MEERETGERGEFGVRFAEVGGGKASGADQLWKLCGRRRVAREV